MEEQLQAPLYQSPLELVIRRDRYCIDAIRVVGHQSIECAEHRLGQLVVVAGLEGKECRRHQHPQLHLRLLLANLENSGITFFKLKKP